MVAITGWGRSEDRQRATEAGFEHHLVKPFEPEALVSLLARIAAGLGGSRAADSDAPAAAAAVAEAAAAAAIDFPDGGR